MRAVPSRLRRHLWIPLLAVIIFGPIYYFLMLARLAPFPDPCETVQSKRLWNFEGFDVEMAETLCPAGPLLTDNDRVQISISKAGDWKWNKDVVMVYLPQLSEKKIQRPAGLTLSQSELMSLRITYPELPSVSYSEPNILRLSSDEIECTLLRRSKWRGLSIEYEIKAPDCARTDPEP